LRVVGLEGVGEAGAWGDGAGGADGEAEDTLEGEVDVEIFFGGEDGDGDVRGSEGEAAGEVGVGEVDFGDVVVAAEVGEEVLTAVVGDDFAEVFAGAGGFVVVDIAVEFDGRRSRRRRCG
jgi:hypothetical protein